MMGLGDKGFIASGLALLLTLSACQSAPNPEPSTSIQRDSMLARIPIHQFADYDPYPPGHTGGINAYVQFQRDGVVRATLGCRTMSGLYQFLPDDTVEIMGDPGMTLSDYEDTECDPDLINREKSLATFLESRPRIYPRCESGCYRILRSNGIDLDLRSVADVLEYN